ncbi:predicted protein [Histoplasma capsulatum G186AR]|uniref:Uncharacterized protein n=1 Tax=Ajellomyces capsulatus (strain G186AR / H82 / ATCC MYA-2454 / RMSCC 2432) TaxID=447093 RepID=C0NUR3_AJECG|nr:uncharacterized protein HCBG_06677 [Histoplasma capsulatum G186AR]EEH04726.1 predicted protein [Histoplasma capsulatum G186AR]
MIQQLEPILGYLSDCSITHRDYTQFDLNKGQAKSLVLSSALAPQPYMSTVWSSGKTSRCGRASLGSIPSTAQLPLITIESPASKIRKINSQSAYVSKNWRLARLSSSEDNIA